MIAYVKGYAAQIERAKIKERSLRGKRYRLEQGRIHGSGPELYGYRRDKERGVREIYEPEAQTVRHIFHAIAVERQSIQSVAAGLTARGVLPPRLSRGIASPYGKVYWHRSAVQRMIREPAYKGETITWRQQRDPKTGGVSRRPVEQHIRLEGMTPAIVDPEIWQAANDRLDTNRGEHTRNAKNPRLLRGFAVCARCGRRMVTTSQYGRNYYKCQSPVSVSGPCGSRMARAEVIEGAVWEEIATFLQNPDLVAEELRRRREEGPSKDLTEELASAQRGLGKVDHQQDRLLRLYAEADEETFPRAAIGEQLRQLGEQKREWEASIAELEHRIDQQEAHLDQLRQVRD